MEDGAVISQPSSLHQLALTQAHTLFGTTERFDHNQIQPARQLQHLSTAPNPSLIESVMEQSAIAAAAPSPVLHALPPNPCSGAPGYPGGANESSEDLSAIPGPRRTTKSDGRPTGSQHEPDTAACFDEGGLLQSLFVNAKRRHEVSAALLSASPGQDRKKRQKTMESDSQCSIKRIKIEDDVQDTEARPVTRLSSPRLTKSAPESIETDYSHLLHNDSPSVDIAHLNDLYTLQFNKSQAARIVHRALGEAGGKVLMTPKSSILSPSLDEVDVARQNKESTIPFFDASKTVILFVNEKDEVVEDSSFSEIADSRNLFAPARVLDIIDKQALLLEAKVGDKTMRLQKGFEKDFETLKESVANAEVREVIIGNGESKFGFFRASEAVHSR